VLAIPGAFLFREQGLSKSSRRSRQGERDHLRQPGRQDYRSNAAASGPSGAKCPSLLETRGKALAPVATPRQYDAPIARAEGPLGAKKWTPSGASSGKLMVPTRQEYASSHTRFRIESLSRAPLPASSQTRRKLLLPQWEIGNEGGSTASHFHAVERGLPGAERRGREAHPGTPGGMAVPAASSSCTHASGQVRSSSD